MNHFTVPVAFVISPTVQGEVVSVRFPMFSRCVQWLLLTIALAFATICHAGSPAPPIVDHGHARAQGVAFEIGATPFPFSDRMHFTHTYVCVGHSTTFAGRKQCFGFYPQNEGITAVFPLPGVVRNENGEWLSEASTLFKTRISPATRKRVLKAVESFDTSYFQLIDFNCIDFAHALARAAFLSTPSRTWWQTPEDYVRELSQLNNSRSK